MSVAIEEILNLDVKERLGIEEIWDSIAAHPEALPLTAPTARNWIAAGANTGLRPNFGRKHTTCSKDGTGKIVDGG